MPLSHLSQLTLPPPRVLKSILYVCIFIPVLPLGSSEPFFFFRFHYARRCVKKDLAVIYVKECFSYVFL